MSNYKIHIKLSDATLKALYEGQYSLIVFKGANGPPDLVSTVWFSQKSLGYNTTVSWQAVYKAYISNSSQLAGATIEATSDKELNTGQLAMVSPSNGLDICPGNTPGYYQVSNNTGKVMTCGISTVDANGKSAPICATNLYGAFTCGMKPTEKVYLTFSNNLTQVGTVWTKTTSSGYVIDCTDPVMNGVTVHFDINKGWSCANKIQALKCTPIDATTSFTKFLNSAANYED